MFITRKHVDRRIFLRGMGAAIALPMLDSMVPAMANPVDNAALAVDMRAGAHKCTARTGYASSASSESTSVTGALQVKWLHT